MNEFIVIFCSTSSKNEAGKIANDIVQKRLAACVNIIEGLTSIYEWEGKICSENEFLMIIKSKKILFDEIKREILSMHSYKVPEIISLPVADGLDSYLNWIRENTK